MNEFLPFKDKKQIQELLWRTDNHEETKRLTLYFEKMKEVRQPFYLTLNELEEIIKWKLRKQFGRQKLKRFINTNDNVIIITKAAFSIKHEDENVETIFKLKLLSTLAGVEIPVASAILTICFPNYYSVVDFRNWRQIYDSGKRKANYTINEYLGYLKIIRQWAIDFGVTPQEIDIAIWQKDLEQKNK